MPLSRARLRLRVHVGPIELLLDPVERVVSDDAAVAQLDQLAALRGVSAAERIGVSGPIIHLLRPGRSPSVAAAQASLVLADEEGRRPVVLRATERLEARARRFGSRSADLAFDRAVVAQ